MQNAYLFDKVVLAGLARINYFQRGKFWRGFQPSSSSSARWGGEGERLLFEQQHMNRAATLNRNRGTVAVGCSPPEMTDDGLGAL